MFEQFQHPVFYKVSQLYLGLCIGQGHNQPDWQQLIMLRHFNFMTLLKTAKWGDNMFGRVRPSALTAGSM